MRADVQHRGVAVHDLFCAVAMVNIKVHNQHLQRKKDKDKQCKRDSYNAGRPSGFFV